MTGELAAPAPAAWDLDLLARLVVWIQRELGAPRVLWIGVRGGEVLPSPGGRGALVDALGCPEEWGGPDLASPPPRLLPREGVVPAWRLAKPCLRFGSRWVRVCEVNNSKDARWLAEGLRRAIEEVGER